MKIKISYKTYSLYFQTYKDSSRKEQFVTRFLLHEILNQFTAVQRAMENASDALDEQAREQK